MEAHRPLFTKFKKFIVVEPSYLDSLKNSCSKSDKLNETDHKLLRVLKNKELNVNQKLNMYRQILLSSSNLQAIKEPQLSNNNRHQSELNSASTNVSDNVFDMDFETLNRQVKNTFSTPKIASSSRNRPFEGVDISVDMSESERERLKDYMAFNESSESKSTEPERYEPYTIPPKPLRSSWSKYEDMIEEENARHYAEKTLSRQKKPKSVGKQKKQS